MDEQEWTKLKSSIYSWIWRNPRSNRVLVEVASLSSDDDTLDIGCGPGVAVRRAASLVSQAVGVDRSPSMVDIARRRSAKVPNAEFAVGSAEDLPFPDDTFSVAWSAHSFHHWADPGAGLLECQRVIAPGGRLLIVETRSNGDHGLSLDRSLDLSTRLEGLGFVDASVERYANNYFVGARVPSSTSATR
jgi:ubiquinone/menaquinone biosynthesis C-methylase UbiE